jgi:hypothetical protein
MSGSLPCSQVRDLLSDLMDVRRGEVPYPDGTPISTSGMRAALESHLAGCANCRAELLVLEETCSAFSDYSVSELPAQHFADYGARVRARMNQKPVFQMRSARRNRWLGAVAALSAAACLTFVVGRTLLPRFSHKHDNVVALNDVPPAKSITGFSVPTSPARFIVKSPQNGVLQASEILVDPNRPSSYDKLKQDENLYGYLIFGEGLEHGNHPLLGINLKTTRDTDRIKNEMPVGLMVWSVEDGSPAQRMGLRRGDLIVQANDLVFNNGGAEEAANFLTALAARESGSPIQLHVVRPVGNQYLYLKPRNGILGQYE